MRGTKIAVGLVIAWAVHRAWHADERVEKVVSKNRSPHRRTVGRSRAGRTRTRPKAVASSR